MNRKVVSVWLVAAVCAAGVNLSMAQSRGPRARAGGGRGQPQRGLRPLSGSDMPPNFGVYTVDPLYDPNAVLGWATTRIEEKIDRGMVAVALGEGKVYLGWRLLKSDPPGIAFDVFRSVSGKSSVKLNNQPLTKTCDFVDTNVPMDQANTWSVARAVRGDDVSPVEDSVSLPANAPAQQYRSIPLKDDVRGVAMVAIGDLDGDGVYDFVVKHPAGGKDPGRFSPNRDTYKYDGYNGKTGQFMWRIDLGWNVDMGIWWTPLIVRDLDGDNKAEVCVRGSSYAATEADMQPSGKTGFILDAPEYLIVYDGATGKEIDKAPWIELDKPELWGDHSGNRASRHMMAVAYLDGKTPAVLEVRGTYGMMRVDAYVLQDRKLRKVWRWTNERAPFLYHGQGQHTMLTGDIDGDGFDEIINGSLAIDQNGRTMWSTGMGHGDRCYMGDIDPGNPGWEIWYVIEDPHPRNGVCLVDARSGRILFGADEFIEDNTVDTGFAADIDPAQPGLELAAQRFYYNSRGTRLPGPVPPQGLMAWWDADLLREFVGRGRPSKWNGSALTPIEGTAIEGEVQQVADILGDWREELVTTTRGELRIYSTVIPAADRRVCLMQDPLYRSDVTHHTVGYTNRHYPMTSYYLGTK